jgi:hypothetical protein
MTKKKVLFYVWEDEVYGHWFENENEYYKYDEKLNPYDLIGVKITKVEDYGNIIFYGEKENDKEND